MGDLKFVAGKMKQNNSSDDKGLVAEIQKCVPTEFCHATHPNPNCLGT